MSHVCCEPAPAALVFWKPFMYNGGTRTGTRTWNANRNTDRKRGDMQRVYLLGFLYYNILLNFRIADYGGML